MRAPLSWLAEYTDVAPGTTGAQVAESFVSVGLEEEAIHGGDISGPVVVGRVLSFDEQRQQNGKTIRYCVVDVGPHGQMKTEGKHQEIVCGATNFEVGDLVVVVLPGATLAGGFSIAARKTYGRMSNGMICAEDELGIGHDHTGIIVLTRRLSPEQLDGVRVGDDAIALLGLGEEVVEVNVTPDRGYCFSMRGLAREYWHSQGSADGGFRDPALLAVPAATDDGYAVRLADAVPIDDQAGCDRFVARVVRGIDPNRPSPPWMQRRLTQMGMRPISLAVDVTNYVMLALGQPLHAYDIAKLSGAIEVRRARPGETLTTLDDVVRTLEPEDLLITDGGDAPLGIAGVMGGATSEVTATTTDVLVEAAHFDPVTVARSSRRHKLVTEASKRFERGVDPALPPAAAQLCVDLLVEHGGGTADPAVTDVDETTPRTAYALEVALPSRLVGVDYPRERIVDILRAEGCEVDDDGGETVRVTPPSWRPDLVDGPDYAEEVARIDGYAKIPSIVRTPAVRAAASPTPSGCGGSSPTRSWRADSSRCLPTPSSPRGSPTLLGCPPTTSGGTRSGWRTRCPTRRHSCARRSSRRSSRRCAATCPAAAGTSRSSSWGWSPCPVPEQRIPRRCPVSTDGRTRRRSRPSTRPSRASPGTWRPSWRVKQSARAGGVPGGPRRGRTRWSRRWPLPAPSRCPWPSNPTPTAPPGTRAAAPASCSPTEPSSATPASCTPRR